MSFLILCTPVLALLKMYSPFLLVLYCLRIFNVLPEFVQLFYTSVIWSIMTFSLEGRGCSIEKQDRDKLNKIIEKRGRGDWEVAEWIRDTVSQASVQQTDYSFSRRLSSTLTGMRQQTPRQKWKVQGFPCQNRRISALFYSEGNPHLQPHHRKDTSLSEAAGSRYKNARSFVFFVCLFVSVYDYI